MTPRCATFTVLVVSGICVAGGCRDATLTGPTEPAADAGAALHAIDPDAHPLAAEASDLPVEAQPVRPVLGGPPEVFVGAGDIAVCGSASHEGTSRLLDSIGGTVFALGDNSYFSGTTREYNECYHPTWGRHRSRTRPVPGNHEYESPGAAPYFEYFRANAGPAGLGYYSFELGAWHVVALNSNIPVSDGSAQAAWLRADLEASGARCTLAYWHHPRFSSGRHGNQDRMRDFWRILYESGADLVLSAHDHTYERFAPQDPDGTPDPVRGIRQFVVGTGGANPYPFVTVRANSEVRLSTLGVLKLTLDAAGYEWEFISLSGPGDVGSGTCR